MGDGVRMMERGGIVARGTPHEGSSAPLQETVAQLAGFENIFDATVWLVHEDRGTMTCRLPVKPNRSFVLLESPLIGAHASSLLRVGILSRDILVPIAKPECVSTRNIIARQIVSLARHDI